jgi:hypothetical protein
VDHDLESAVANRRLQIGQNVDQVAVALIIVPIDPPGPVSLPELEQQGREVVGQIAILDAGGSQRVPNHDIEEECLRGQQHRAHGEQALEQLRGIQ